jgi:hypothetical protein
MKKILLSLIFLAAFSSFTLAASFVVNNNGDTNDAIAGNGVCADANGNCTMRAAIQEANALPSNDVITFNSEIYVITLTLGEITISNAGTIQIIGSGANVLTIDAGRRSRIFYADNVVATIMGVTLTGGNGMSPRFSMQNSSCNGAGILVNEGSMTLDSVHVTGNSPSCTVPASGSGGGVAFQNGTNHLIRNSTFSDNGSTGGGGFSKSGGSLTIVNSTLSSNSVRGIGGGFSNTGDLTLRNVTIVNNSARIGTMALPGWGFIHSSGILTVGNSIIEGCEGGPITSIGNNLISCSPNSEITYQSTDILNRSAALTDLGMNGGPTPTHALLSISPAINAGSNANAPDTTDQRGFARIVGGTIDIGAVEFEFVCNPSISSTNQQIGANANTITVNVSNTSGCSWSAQSSVDWISILTGSSGNGNGTVSLSIQPNTGVARTGTVTIAGQPFTITQASGCNYVLSPAAITHFPSTGGNGSFTVTTEAGCTWTATPNEPWITITSGNTGTGNGTVNFTVTRNDGDVRNGAITVGNQTFTFTQFPFCTFSVSAATLDFSGTGGAGNFTVNNTNPACNYLITSDDDWITNITPNSGGGLTSSTHSFNVAANFGVTRTGTITVRDRNLGYSVSITINQTNGCSYTLSPSSTNFPASGGTGSFNITTNSAGCSWTATSSASWITINSASSGAGNGSVTFTLQPNVGVTRTAIITVNDKVFTITQASGCTYTLSANQSQVFPDSGGTGSFIVNTAAGCSWTALNNSPWITITSGSVITGSGTVTYSVAPNSETSGIRVWGIVVGNQTYTVSQSGSGDIIRKPHVDFDGDGKTDVSVYRPSDGVWHLQRSRDGYTSFPFGISTDKLVPADYDGDLKTDVAVFRENPENPSFANYYILSSRDNTFRAVQFGSSGDIPVEGDWDGDYKFDVGVYRPGTEANPQGHFYYRPSSQPNINFISIPWGSRGDKPVAADFDRDGKTDAAVFRPSNGAWYIQRSTDGFYAIQFGAAEDIPVVGDYDGDRKADQAVFRPSDGVWYVWNSRDNRFSAIKFGISTDKPVPGDYDGDGKNDLAVYRDGVWFILNSTTGFTALGFGNATDKPVPNSFVP